MRSFTSFLRNIVGPRTFTWQGALTLSLIATVGSIVLYGNHSETNLSLYLVIFLIAQVCALFVYVFSGMIMVRIPGHNLQAIFVLVSYILFCVVRAYVAEKLLWRTNSISENLLMWRIRSNLIVNLPAFVGTAWVMNAREESNNRLNSLRSQGAAFSKELEHLNMEYSEQRSYGERELALEISSAKQLLDGLQTNKTFTSQYEPLLMQLLGSIHHASQAVKALSHDEISKRHAISQDSIRFSAVSVIDHITRKRGVSPWFASATGFFFSLAYAHYQSAEGSPLMSMFLMATVMFAILLVNKRVIIPKISAWNLWARIVAFETIAIVANIWWSVFTTRFVLDEPLPYGITTAAALTSLFVMNVLSFMQGVFDQRAEHGKLLAHRNEQLALALEETRQIMSLEESIWKQMFVGDISRTPTAANVMLKNLSDNVNARNVHEQLLTINDIWRQVLVQLRHVS